MSILNPILNPILFSYTKLNTIFLYDISKLNPITIIITITITITITISVLINHQLAIIDTNVVNKVIQ